MIEQLFATADRASVVGTYSITTALGEVLMTGVTAGVGLEALTTALSAGSADKYVLSGYLPTTPFTEEGGRRLRARARAQGSRPLHQGRGTPTCGSP